MVSEMASYIEIMFAWLQNSCFMCKQHEEHVVVQAAHLVGF
jgi:CRISPR/Cas system-associated endoribonuclease Cas2